MRSRKKRRSRIARGNRFNRKRAQWRFTPAAKLGKALREAFCAVGIPNVESRGLDRRVAQQNACQLEATIARDTYNCDLSGISHFTRASIFFWRDSRVFLLGVMINTVSSPAMVPAISVNFDPSTAAARGCAPLGGVFSTRRFSAGRMSSRNSASARASGGKGVGSSGNAEDCLYPSWVFTRRSSCKSRESVAWVTRIFCAASRRRSSSWLPMRSPLTSRRICPWRNVFPVPITSTMHIYTDPCIFLSMEKQDFLWRSHGPGADWGGRDHVRFGASGQTGTGFSDRGMLLIVLAPGPHGNNLPSRRMQERLALGACRAEVVRVALYPVPGNQLRTDAPGDGPGACAPGPPARDHALHYRTRR